MSNLGRIEGIRSTKQRKAVLDVFANDLVHLTAEEVYLQVKQSQPSISLGTVYRNLELLNRMGLLNQFMMADGTRKYELASDHHHHLICIDCGKATNIPDCPITNSIKNHSFKNGFSIVRHTFEVFGYCAQCQAVKKEAVVSAYKKR